MIDADRLCLLLLVSDCCYPTATDCYVDTLPCLCRHVAAAAAEAKVLRYAASIQPATATSRGSLTVGLLNVPASSPLGTLSGALL